MPDPSLPESGRGVTCVKADEFDRAGIAIWLSDERSASYVLRGHDAGATRVPDPAAALAARPDGVAAARSASGD